MKRMLLLFFLLVTLQVSAQEVNFIPKVGFNLAKTTKMDLGYKLGLNIGCDVEFLLSKHFAIEPGVYYSVQGGKGDVGESLSHDYINIPIMAKGYLYKGFFVEAGPQVGFLVSSKLNDTSLKEMMHTFDLSLGVGIGYQMAWGMMISANYNFGLTDVCKKTYLNIIDEESVESTHNSVLQVNIGWRF